MSRVDVDQLPDVAIGLRPMELVAPRFIDSGWLVHRFPFSLIPFPLSLDLTLRSLRHQEVRHFFLNVLRRVCFQRSCGHPCGLAHPQLPQDLLGQGNGAWRHAELTQPQTHEERQEHRIGRHLSADRHPDPALSTRAGDAAQQPEDRRVEGLVERDTRSSVRSTASAYWMRSFVPMLKKSASEASRSAVRAAEGTSIMTPIGTGGACSPSRATRRTRAPRCGVRLSLLHTVDEREHDPQRPVHGGAQERADLRREDFLEREAQANATQSERRTCRRYRRGGSGLGLAHVERADRPPGGTRHWRRDDGRPRIALPR